MNLPALASDIVRRVKGSPDSVTNLETIVAALIREELERDAILSRDGYVRLDELDRISDIKNQSKTRQHQP